MPYMVNVSAHRCMVALGDGAVDIPAIVQAAAHAEWLVVELDEVAGDVDTAIERSFRYLSQYENGRKREGIQPEHW